MWNTGLRNFPKMQRKRREEMKIKMKKNMVVDIKNKEIQCIELIFWKR